MTKPYDKPDPRARVVALDLLVPWDQNPRKSMGDLEELADSIGSKGILQSLIVRPAEGGKYEIVSGERRWRAAQLTAEDTAPVIVREDLANDDDALEANVVENIQRADVHPLEEADGIAALRARGRSVEDIAAGIGRPKSYVYRRLALVNLCEAGREAFLAGELTTGGAEVLARLPDTEMQTSVLERSQPWRPEGGAVPTHELRRVVAAMSLDLEKAQWDLDDATLVEEAGACSSCPKRSNAQAQLFGEAEEDDRCLDETCFAGKRAAHGDRVIEIARSEKRKVLNPDEALKIYPAPWSAANVRDHGYIDLEHREKGRTWREIIGDRKVKPVVVRNPHSGDVHSLVKIADVEKLLAKHPRDGDPELAPVDDGDDDAPPSRSRSSSRKPTKEDLVREATHQAADELITQMVDRVAAGELPVLVGLRYLAEELVAGHLNPDQAAARRELVSEGATYMEAQGALDRFVTTANEPELLALCIEAMFWEDFPLTTRPDGQPSAAQRIVEDLGIDWFALEQDAIAEATATPGKCRECGCSVDDKKTLCSACAKPDAGEVVAEEPAEETEEPTAAGDWWDEEEPDAIATTAEEPKKKPRKCGKCGEVGHNARSCKAESE